MNPSLRLIPVLDIQRDEVVRGVGGRRSEYRLVESYLTESTEPFDVAEALVREFAPTEIYIADLDAIVGETPSSGWRAAIRQLPVKIWLDAGVRCAADVGPLLDGGIDGVVLGLETLDGSEVFETLSGRFDPSRLIFSLDMRGGCLLGDWRRWHAKDERDWPTIVNRVAASGIRRLIVLDLHHVGEGRGVGTEGMCRAIAELHSELEIICGGGVRNVADLRKLQECGAAGALVASALHDGRIKPGDWPTMF